jgi:hypothetical protein
VDGRRDPTPVVGDGDPARLEVDRDLDAAGLARLDLVDRVVEDLIDQVVEPPHARGADVHPGALAHGLEALQDLSFG